MIYKSLDHDITRRHYRVRFFEDTFMVANISPEVVLELHFLSLSGADVDSLGRELIKEAFLTTRHVKLVDKQEIVAAELDLEHETYVVHVGSVNSVVLSSSSPGSYKSLCQVCWLCRYNLSGLGFQTSRVDWDQRSCYQTDWCQQIHQTIQVTQLVLLT